MLRAKNFGSGLLTLGLGPGENTRLGILARYETLVTSHLMTDIGTARSG